MGTSEDWARLPTQTRGWREACLEVWPGRVEHVEVDGGEATLLRRGRVYELVGRELHEPGDVLYRDEESGAHLAAALRRRPFTFNRVLCDSPLAEARGAVVRPRPGSPVVSLEAWRDGATGLSKRRDADLRRARRKAEGLGAVEIEIVSPADGEAEANVARVAAVEDASWKGAAGTSLARDPRRLAFFAAFARRAAEAGELRCAFLSIGGRDAAAQLALQWRDAYWLLKIGYDASFADVSPGQLLMRETIAHAADRGLARYEFLGTAAPWTGMWTRDERPTASIAWGTSALVAEAARRLRRQVTR